MAVPFGKFQLLRKIASGGMGQVFLALEQGGGYERLVVLKLILPHLAEDEDFLSMFRAEAKLVMQLSHPNLIPIFEQADIEGRYYLAMDYVQGDDLRRLEKFARGQAKPLPVGLALRVIAEAAAGLDYAHHARDASGQPMRLVHRDVSPQNILVGFDGGVRIIDFGVAKAAGSASNTATGVLKGKYPYMSPEQAGGQAVDGRSDQFALGVVLWELLTNRRLFKGDSDLMTLRLVRECQVPPPSQLNPRLPPGVDELVLKALAVDPAGRYPDCGAFRLAIEDYILQYRLPASTAHLSAYLRELYAERIAREADPANLDQLTEDSDLDAKSNPSRSLRSLSQQPSPAPLVGGTSGSHSRSARLAPQPAPAPLTKHTQTLVPVDTVQHRRPFPTVPVVASLGALLIAAGAAVIFLRQEPAPQVAVPPPVQVVRPEPAPAPPEQPEPTPEPQPVVLQVVSEPEGAVVVVDGEELGPAPQPLSLAPDAPPVTVALKLDGYETVSRQVSAGDGPELSVKLKPKPRPARRPAPQLDIKTGR